MRVVFDLHTHPAGVSGRGTGQSCTTAMGRVDRSLCLYKLLFARNVSEDAEHYFILLIARLTLRQYGNVDLRRSPRGPPFQMRARCWSVRAPYREV